MTMSARFHDALSAGTERVAAWADLLDRINVFPIADGDTGRNLIISLLPLKSQWRDNSDVVEQLLLNARGNSGNIAAQFFSGFISHEETDLLPEAVKIGNTRAQHAVSKPEPGTMLTFFDALESALGKARIDDEGGWVNDVLENLEHSVNETTRKQSVLEKAGVVDSGALGMFIFFDAFFNMLYGKKPQFTPIASVFKDRLAISPSWDGTRENGDCIDAVVKVSGDTGTVVDKMSRLGMNVVAFDHEEYVKIHIHTGDQSAVRDSISRMGSLVRWAADDLRDQTMKFSRPRPLQAIHVMTDAAGSVTREDAFRLDITLLNSYITIGSTCAPETHFNPLEMYTAMSKGIKVSTSQASVFERHQHYEKVVSLYKNALYLCVGSVFTGNYQVVTDWKRDNDPDDCLTVIDTTAASGRLGLIALATARFSLIAESAQSVRDFALRAVAECKEYIFLDKLYFLAAGGRLSRTSAFFGDILRMKPVVTPVAEGVKRVAVVRNTQEQVSLAFQKLEGDIKPQEPALIMLEFSDNEQWVAGELKNSVVQRFPLAEVFVHPFSLTSGVHMGPGTWAVAYLPLKNLHALPA